MRDDWKGYYEAFSLICEGAAGVPGFNVALTPASMDKCVMFKDGRMNANVDEFWSNEDYFGNGHGHATDGMVGKVSSDGPSYSGEADITRLAWILYLAMGKVTTTTPGGATNARQHVFEEMTDGNQLPSTNLITRSHTDIGFIQWLGLCCQSVTISGGQDQFVQLSYTLKGSGKRISGVTYTPVAASEMLKLRQAFSTFKYGDPGGMVDKSGQVIDWSITIDNPLTPDYAPAGVAGLMDSTNRASAQIAGALNRAKPSYSASVTLYAEDDAPRIRMLNNQKTEIEIACESMEYIEDTTPNSLKISMGQVKLSKVEEVDHDGSLAYKFEAKLEVPASGLLADMFSATMITDTLVLGAVPA